MATARTLVQARTWNEGKNVNVRESITNFLTAFDAVLKNAGAEAGAYKPGTMDDIRNRTMANVNSLQEVLKTLNDFAQANTLRGTLIGEINTMNDILQNKNPTEQAKEILQKSIADAQNRLETSEFRTNSLGTELNDKLKGLMEALNSVDPLQAFLFPDPDSESGGTFTATTLPQIYNAIIGQLSPAEVEGLNQQAVLQAQNATTQVKKEMDTNHLDRVNRVRASGAELLRVSPYVDDDGDTVDGGSQEYIVTSETMVNLGLDMVEFDLVAPLVILGEQGISAENVVDALDITDLYEDMKVYVGLESDTPVPNINLDTTYIWADALLGAKVDEGIYSSAYGITVESAEDGLLKDEAEGTLELFFQEGSDKEGMTIETYEDILIQWIKNLFSYTSPVVPHYIQWGNAEQGGQRFSLMAVEGTYSDFFHTESLALAAAITYRQQLYNRMVEAGFDKTEPLFKDGSINLADPLQRALGYSLLPLYFDTIRRSMSGITRRYEGLVTHHELRLDGTSKEIGFMNFLNGTIKTLEYAPDKWILGEYDAENKFIPVTEERLAEILSVDGGWQEIALTWGANLVNEAWPAVKKIPGELIDDYATVANSFVSIGNGGSVGDFVQDTYKVFATNTTKQIKNGFNIIWTASVKTVEDELLSYLGVNEMWLETSDIAPGVKELIGHVLPNYFGLDTVDADSQVDAGIPSLTSVLKQIPALISGTEGYNQVEKDHYEEMIRDKVIDFSYGSGTTGLTYIPLTPEEYGEVGLTTTSRTGSVVQSRRNPGLLDEAFQMPGGVSIASLKVADIDQRPLKAKFEEQPFSHLTKRDIHGELLPKFAERHGDGFEESLERVRHYPPHHSSLPVFIDECGDEQELAIGPQTIHAFNSMVRTTTQEEVDRLAAEGLGLAFTVKKDYPVDIPKPAILGGAPQYFPFNQNNDKPILNWGGSVPAYMRGTFRNGSAKCVESCLIVDGNSGRPAYTALPQIDPGRNGINGISYQTQANVLGDDLDGVGDVMFQFDMKMGIGMIPKFDETGGVYIRGPDGLPAVFNSEEIFIGPRAWALQNPVLGVGESFSTATTATINGVGVGTAADPYGLGALPLPSGDSNTGLRGVSSEDRPAWTVKSITNPYVPHPYKSVPLEYEIIVRLQRGEQTTGGEIIYYDSIPNSVAGQWPGHNDLMRKSIKSVPVERYTDYFELLPGDDPAFGWVDGQVFTQNVTIDTSWELLNPESKRVIGCTIIGIKKTTTYYTDAMFLVDVFLTPLTAIASKKADSRIPETLSNQILPPDQQVVITPMDSDVTPIYGKPSFYTDTNITRVDDNARPGLTFDNDGGGDFRNGSLIQNNQVNINALREEYFTNFFDPFYTGIFWGVLPDDLQFDGEFNQMMIPLDNPRYQNSSHLVESYMIDYVSSLQTVIPTVVRMKRSKAAVFKYGNSNETIGYIWQNGCLPLHAPSIGAPGSWSFHSYGDHMKSIFMDSTTKFREYQYVPQSGVEDIEGSKMRILGLTLDVDTVLEKELAFMQVTSSFLESATGNNFMPARTNPASLPNFTNPIPSIFKGVNIDKTTITLILGLHLEL